MRDPVTVSDDARTLILLCTSLAVARGQVVRPCGPRTWAKVAERLASGGSAPASFAGSSAAGGSAPAPAPGAFSPASLLGMDGAGLAALLEIGEAEAERIARLLARSGQLAFELDRLAVRGIGVVTLVDGAYPGRLRDRLGPDAPPVLFVAGDRSIVDAGGVAIVGSRDVDAASVAFAETVAAAAAREGAVVVSGGARGVDQLAMRAALDAGGRVAALLPEGIERRVREPSTRAALADGLVALASPYHPAAGFSTGAAMARNRLIYALADAAVVAASAAGTGGTWTGAVEALEAGSVPVFVRAGDDVPEGNRQLLVRGAMPLAPDPVPLPLLPVLAAAARPSHPAPPAATNPATEPATDPATPFEQQTLRLL
jgi:predicted Rossmann fold nucleotide-binding protein DprA/Smf involved in DNA uptake